MIDAILDASALMALINDEPGALAVAEALPSSAIGVVNLAEACSVMQMRGLSADVIETILGSLPLTAIDADQGLAVAAGLLRGRTSHRGLSLGDRFCLALAAREKLPVYTADRAWADLGLDLDIRLIR
ncbi:MAG TPA: type II toxin-antitoxin system VapC family toxin [Beijerinckiaceae bacterium]|nr:type II toxin-antitoxin system VapC family toxin [Beijerinckiaceae bacterium]